jgi:hypothetical protein
MSQELIDYFTGLTADASPDGAADYVITIDISAGLLKKVLINNLPSSGGISGLGSTDNAVVRANGTGGTAAQGSLVTIDDSGAITFPGDQYLTSSAKRLMGYNTGGGSMVVNPDGISTVDIKSGAGGDVRFGQYLGDQFGLFDDNATAQETRLKIWDVTAAAMVRVSRGASDSGGTGFRLLRVPN